MLNPTVSIVIPVYNAAVFLRECLDSILSQRFADFEVIAVNDGSTDNSLEILEEYTRKDSRIIVINKPNGGVSSARNTGIRNSRGKYITFIDSDDTVAPSYLSNFSYNDDFDYEIQGLQLFYTHDNTSVYFNQKFTRIIDLKRIIEITELNRTSRGPYVKLFKTNIIRENSILFDENLSYGEDAIFVKEYLYFCKGKAKLIDKTDYIYYQRCNPDSLTKINHHVEKRLSATKKDFNCYLRLADTFGPFSEEMISFFTRERVLEIFAAYTAALADNTIPKYKKITLSKEILDLLKLISYKGNLPYTYKCFNLSLSYLSAKFAYYLNYLIANIIQRIKRIN